MNNIFVPTLIVVVPVLLFLIMYFLAPVDTRHTDLGNEKKHDPAGLGVMPMTRGVRWSLYTLRGYLVLMGLLVIYHVAHVAGCFK